MNSPVNITYICSTLSRKGPVVQLYTLIKCLDKHRFRPRILTLSPEPSDSLLASFRKLDVPCYSLGLSRLEGIFLGAMKLRQFLRDFPTDITHTFGLRADILSALVLNGISRIATKHGAWGEHSILHQGPVLGPVLEGIHSIWLGKLERIVCVSEYIRETAPSRLLPLIVVIQNGINEGSLRPATSPERRSLRQRLGLAQNIKLFVFAGTLSRTKDPITVLRGFLAGPGAEDGTLVFLGDGPLRLECGQLASGHSNIRMVGRVENVADYLRAADVFISGSLTEGLPMVVLEALACGLPVVLSDIGAHREILAFNPTAGKLFPVKDVSVLARTLDEVLNADYEIMRRAALNIAHHHLNARRMSLQYQALYIDCYKEHRKS